MRVSAERLSTRERVHDVDRLDWRGPMRTGSFPNLARLGGHSRFNPTRVGPGLGKVPLRHPGLERRTHRRQQFPRFCPTSATETYSIRTPRPETDIPDFIPAFIFTNCGDLQRIVRQSAYNFFFKMRLINTITFEMVKFPLDMPPSRTPFCHTHGDRKRSRIKSTNPCGDAGHPFETNARQDTPRSDVFASEQHKTDCNLPGLTSAASTRLQVPSCQKRSTPCMHSMPNPSYVTHTLPMSNRSLSSRRTSLKATDGVNLADVSSPPVQTG